MNIVHEYSSIQNLLIPVKTNNQYHLYIDGGARGNPGPAASAWILTDSEGNVVKSHAERIGTATNNVAEYRALLEGLKETARRGIGDITVYSDSELLVRQMQGVYKIKNEKLQEIAGDVIKLRNAIQLFKIKHIRRELNKDADALVNTALDQAEL